MKNLYLLLCPLLNSFGFGCDNFFDLKLDENPAFALKDALQKSIILILLSSKRYYILCKFQRISVGMKDENPVKKFQLPKNKDLVDLLLRSRVSFRFFAFLSFVDSVGSLEQHLKIFLQNLDIIFLLEELCSDFIVSF